MHVRMSKNIHTRMYYTYTDCFYSYLLFFVLYTYIIFSILFRHYYCFLSPIIICGFHRRLSVSTFSKYSSSFLIIPSSPVVCFVSIFYAKVVSNCMADDEQNIHLYIQKFLQFFWNCPNIL